jgi:PIN domain nuclease of toxin-antitoxin system
VSLLLDTQLIVWSGLAPDRLGDARGLLEQEDLFLSAASAWELAIKQGLGKLDLGVPVHLFFRAALRELGGVEVPVTAEVASAVETLPPVHGDPFDRLLVVQTQHLGARLLTADRTLPAYGQVVQLV